MLNKQLNSAFLLLYTSVFVFIFQLDLFSNSVNLSTGFLELSDSEKEQVLENFVTWEAPVSPTRSSLPLRVVNTDYLPKVSSQGSLGVCGSYCVYYYLYTYYYAKERNLDFRPDPDTTPQQVSSPAWGVLTAPHGNKASIDRIIPWGASPLAAIETIVQQGVVSWDDLPYSDSNDFFQTLPDATLMKKALHNKALQGIILNGLHTEQGLQNLKQFLAAGNIAVTAWLSPLNANFDSYPDPVEISNGHGDNNDADNKGVVLAWPGEGEPRMSEGHAITIVGYDDEKAYYNKEGELCHGALLIVNSWGEDWGLSPEEGVEGGFAWLSYDLLLKYRKLDNQAFSMKVRSEDYQPKLVGTFTLENENDNNWQTAIGGYQVFWPSLLNMKNNGQSLNRKISANEYIIYGNVEGQNKQRQYVFDLSGVQENQFVSLELSCPVLTGGETLGKITGLTTNYYENNTEIEYSVPDVNLPVERYSPEAFNPTFYGEIAMLQKKESPLPDLFPQSASFCWGDANGDGLPDLAVSAIQKTAAADSELEVIHRVYLNNGNGGFANFVDISIPESASLRGQLSELRWADMNNDGHLDLVAANMNGVYIFLNNENASFTLWKSMAAPIEIEVNNNTFIYRQSFGPGSMVVADFDLDGRPDIAISGDGAVVGTQILFQLEPGEFTSFKISERFSNIGGHGVSAAALEVGDIDGDGYPDLVAASASANAPSDPELIWYRNNADYSFTPKKLPLPPMDQFSIAIADFNNDGCDDILYSGGKQTGNRVNGVLKGRSDGYPERVAWDGNLPPLWGGKVLWADLNNDGTLEAIICGVETNAMPDLGDYGYGNLLEEPKRTYKNFCRVHHWNNLTERFEDSGLSLPGTVGFAGPSMLSAIDFDNDGDIDLLTAGVFTVKAQFFKQGGPGKDICGIQYFENRASDFLGIERINQAPNAPTGLNATALGNAKAQFNWTAQSDDLTPAGGLRYFLRIGTSTGSENVLSAKVPFLAQELSHKSGVIFRRLPAKKLYWSVRAMDANGLLSEWSTESTVTVTGSESLPQPGNPISEESPPPAIITVTDLDSDGNSGVKNIDGTFIYSGGYTSGSSSAAEIGSTIILKATPRAGWRFSHWEGEVYSPLARKTKMLVTGNANPVARFIPDDKLLYSSDTHSALRGKDGKLWTWSAILAEDAEKDAKLGEYFQIAEDGLPGLAAQEGISCLGVNNDRTFYGILNGEYDAAADNHKNFMRDSLMAVLGLDGFSWWENRGFGYDERSLDFWTYGNSYLASYITPGNNNEYNEIFFSGDIYNIWKKGAWQVSQQSENEINLGIVQAAMTDNFVLFLSDQGDIYAVGNNGSGQFGDGTTTGHTQNAPKLIEGLPKFKAIAVGEDVSKSAAFALAIDFQGRLWSWGNNDYGQLGLGYYGDSTGSLTPQQLTAFSSPVVAIACGYRHALAKTQDGQVYGWGDNNRGQAGQSEIDGEGELVQKIVASPSRVAGLDNVFSIAAAAEHSLALLLYKEEQQDRTEIFVWGDNSSGQLTGKASEDIWTPFCLENPPKLLGNGSFKISMRSVADAPGTATEYPGIGEIFPAPGTYASRIDSTLQIEAVDGDRYVFSHWEEKVLLEDEENWIELGENSEELITAILLSENTEICAVFQMKEGEDLQLLVGIDSEDRGAVQPQPGQYPLSFNDNITFRALPRAGFKLNHWETATDLQEKRQQNEFEWTLKSDMDISAKFISQPFLTKAIPNIGGGTFSLTEEGKILRWTSYNHFETFDFAGVPIVTTTASYIALGSNGRLYSWTTDRQNRFVYSLLPGPDGEEFFSDAVAVFSLDRQNFAQRADGRIYIWGRIPLSEEDENSPRLIRTLPNAKLLEIVEFSGTVFFLFENGDLYSWGGAEYSGTGKLHEEPKLVLEGIKGLAANDGQILVLTTDGIVYSWGTEVYGFGGTSAKIYGAPQEIPNFSSIKKIFASYNSCYAIAENGKLYVWGTNRRYDLGVGSNDSNLKYYSPTLHPNSELPEFLTIRAGSGGWHIAEAVDGTLWKWGWNNVAYNQHGASLQMNLSEITQDLSPGELKFNQTPFTNYLVNLSTDSRCEHLLSFNSGVHTFLEGEKIVVFANSSEEYTFAGWEKDGDFYSAQAYLEISVNKSFSLFARYDIADPLLELQDCEGQVGKIAKMPLTLSNTSLNYEAFDFTISFPEELSFRGLESEDTQLNENCVTQYWLLPKQTGNSEKNARIRIIVRQDKELFSASATPLAKMLFEIPYSLKNEYIIKIETEEKSVLSRTMGKYADEAEANISARIIVDFMNTEKFSLGWMYYSPFDSLAYDSFITWNDELALQGIKISPFAWYWDTEKNRWEKSLIPLLDQPMLLYVEKGGLTHKELELPANEISLKKGWNLISVPETIARPEDALVIFSIENNCCQFYDAEYLEPNLMYWIFY